MKMQKRSDERSIAMHKVIAKKLRNNPALWDIPKQNIIRWKKMRDKLPPALIEWEYILRNKTKAQILFILESSSEDAIRLRSSSPFTGILDESERKMIFEYFNQKNVK